MTMFPQVGNIGPVPLLAIPAAAALLALLLSLFLLRWYGRHLSAYSQSASFHVARLAARTRDLGVSYAEIVFGKLLGKGSQGEVFLAQWRGLSVAVKKVDTREVATEIVEEFVQEADIMRQLRHPALTLFLGVSLADPHLCIVTELVSRGALFDLLQEEATGYTWRRGVQIAVDIASGMTYLHSHVPKIIHRDLKSLNVLVTSLWRGKVADFGMSRFQAPTDEASMTQCGSPLWMAPEMIKNEAYDESADVYSFAIVLWELYTRRVPYRELGLSPSALVVKVVRDNLRPHIPRDCPKKLVSLMKACWHRDPAKRPTFDKILRVLEGFLADKAFLAHKPKLEDRDEEEEEEQEEEIDLHDGTKQRAAVDSTSDKRRDEADVVDLLSPAGNKDAARGGDDAAEFAALLPAGDSWQLSPHDRAQLEVSHTRILGASEPMPSPREGGSHAHAHGMVHTVLESPLDPPSEQSGAAMQRLQRVYRAKYRGKAVVLRRVPLSNARVKTAATSRPGDSSDRAGSSAGAHLDRLLRRASSMRHPNLVLLLGAFVEYDHVGIVEEEVGRGSATGLLSTPSAPLEWEQALQLLLDAASGLAALHAVGMAHPDLRPSKLLLTNGWRCKIAGYAFANLDVRLAAMEAESSHSSHGADSSRANAAGASVSPPMEVRPSIWSSPEHVLAGDDPLRALNAGWTPTAADNAYSFGLIAWSMLMRRMPFEGKFGPKLRRKIVEGFRLPVPMYAPQRLQLLLKACWSIDPARRPSMLQIVSALTSALAEGPPSIRLSRANSRVYRKAATVFAFESKDPVTFLKDTGKNRGAPGDLVVASSTLSPSAAAAQGVDYFSTFTDLSVVSAEVFRRSYEPNGSGFENEFRRKGMVRARRMEEPFAIRTGVASASTLAGTDLPQAGAALSAEQTFAAGGNIEQGMAGDFVLQNDSGDQWVVDARTMDNVYVLIEGQEDGGTDAVAPLAPASTAAVVATGSTPGPSPPSTGGWLQQPAPAAQPSFAPGVTHAPVSKLPRSSASIADGDRPAAATHSRKKSSSGTESKRAHRSHRRKQSSSEATSSTRKKKSSQVADSTTIEMI